MPEPAEISKWPTTSEAARVLNRSAQMVQIYMNRGILRFIPTRAGRLIDPADLQRLRRELEAAVRSE